MARRFYAYSRVNLWESMGCKVGEVATPLTIQGPSKGCILVYDTIEDLLKDWPEADIGGVLTFGEVDSAKDQERKTN